MYFPVITYPGLSFESICFISKCIELECMSVSRTRAESFASFDLIMKILLDLNIDSEMSFITAEGACQIIVSSRAK